MRNLSVIIGREMIKAKTKLIADVYIYIYVCVSVQHKRGEKAILLNCNVVWKLQKTNDGGKNSRWLKRNISFINARVLSSGFHETLMCIYTAVQLTDYRVLW